jgi:hypothetical protein
MATLSTTNSYVTFADYQEYCDLTGRTPIAQATIEPKLIQGTLALDRKYGGRFMGRKQSATQPLQWPRSATYARTIDVADGVYTQDGDGNYRDFNTVPVEVKQATCEMALGLLSGEDVYTQDQPMVTEDIKKVDVLWSTKKYQGTYQPKSQLVFTIDLILRPLLLPAATKVKFVA